MRRRFPIMAGLLAWIAIGLTMAAHGGEADATPAARLVTGSGRAVFWRGEVVVLSFTSPAAEAAPTRITLTRADGPAAQTIYTGSTRVAGERTDLHLCLSTRRLGRGAYRATAAAGERTATVDFRIRDVILPSPGMVIDDNGRPGVAANADLAGLTAFVDYMSSDATHSAFRRSREALNAFFDRLTHHQMLHWIQDSTRPMSFSPPHSSAEHHGEYARRMVLMDAALMQYPNFGGQLFDYDPTGFYTDARHLVSYWRWGDLVDDLQAYMKRMGEALHDNFRSQTDLESPTRDELLSFAAAIGAAEAMGYIDQPTRVMAYEIASRAKPLPEAQMASLKKRLHAWFAYLMDLNRRRYVDYMDALDRLDPSLAHATSNTLGHNGLRDGHHYASSYRPCDFRYVSVWNDQAGNPEYPFQTPYAAVLLNQERDLRQPLWVGTVFNKQMNGHHFRNSLLLAAFGGQGTGYSFEIGNSQAALASGMLNSNSPRNREVELSGRLMRRFGDLFRQARFRPRVGILASETQAHIRPPRQVIVDGQWKLMYLLAHSNLPPAFVTERAIVEGKADDLDVLLVQHQTEALPDAVEAKLAAFVAQGGRVLTDTATTVQWDFAERSAALDLPFRDLGHPYNTATPYNRHDNSVATLRDLLQERGPKLRALLMPVRRNLAVDCSDPEVLLSELDGGAGRFVLAVNESRLDFAELFDFRQKRSSAYQKLLIGHGDGLVTSWTPRRAALVVDERYATGGAVYDLFQRTRLDPVRRGGAHMIEADLASTTGRILALYPAPVGAGALQATQTVEAGAPVEAVYRAAAANGEALAAVVPLRVRLHGPDGTVLAELFRATTSAGIANVRVPTGALGPQGDHTLEVIQLLDGQGVRLPLTVAEPAPVQAAPAPSVAVRDPGGIKAFLDSGPELVVPVFDAALRSLADKVVAGLKKRGVNARLWQDPPLTTYTLSYNPQGEGADANAKVRAGEAIGKVAFRNRKHHVNGNFYGSALTGFRYGGPILLLGTKGQNEVLDGVLASRVLWTDASTSAPGRGLVQRIPYLLDRDAGDDTLVVCGADEAGLEAAVDALLALPDTDPVTAGVRTTRTRILRGRGLPLDWQPPAVEAKLSATDAATVAPQAAQEAFGIVAIRDVCEVGDRLAVRLGRGASSLALVDANGGVTPLASVATRTRLHRGESILVSTTGHMVFAYDQDGAPLWRAVGGFHSILPGTDTVVVTYEGGTFAVEPDATSRKLEAAPEGKATQPEQTLLIKKRGLGIDAVKPYVPATDRTVTFGLETRYLTDAAISADEQTVAVCGMEGGVRLLDLAGEEKAALAVGRYPRLWALAGGGFAVASADGCLTVIDSQGEKRFTADVAAATLPPAEVYARLRAAPLLTWTNPQKAMDEIDLSRFFWYLKNEKDELVMVNWRNRGKALDFRWFDAASAEIRFPESRTYAVTVSAAAKYYDQEPMSQPNWGAFVKMRQAVMTEADRTETFFKVYVNGTFAGRLDPEGGELKPFVTEKIKEGWATLKPKPEEMTTFTGTIEAKAGAAQVSIEAVGMTDCFAKHLSFE